MLPTKTQFYALLADRQARQITESSTSWTSFLTTAARLYKYPFEDQLLIHAQRPNVQACAPIEVWNNSMNRFVKRGSKGIALIDTTSGKPRLKYVFDYADTEDGWRNSRQPFIWELKPEHEQIVLEVLNKNYDVSDYLGGETNNSVLSKNHIDDTLYGLAQKLSARYYEDYKTDIQYSVEGSFLENYDEYNVEAAFKKAMTVSIAYTLMTRCGIDPAKYIEAEDFQPIFDFNSPNAVYALGKAVSTVAEEVLRDIEVTIKKYERDIAVKRSVTHGRTEIHPTGGLSSSEYNVERGSDRTTRQIWNDEKSVPARTSADSVYAVHPERDAVRPLSGDRERSNGTAINDDGAIISKESAARQGHRPDGVDSTYERTESPSGGINPERVDLQLKPFDDVTAVAHSTFTLFPELPTEQAQIKAIQQSKKAPSIPASVFSEPKYSQVGLMDIPGQEQSPSQAQDIIAVTQTAYKEQLIPAVNFRITDDNLGEGGAKTKYNFNVTAIRTLQAIEAENRRATPQEQEILSRYVGWGGIQQAFDPNIKQWEREYAELKNLLTPDEHKMAQASTLNAHYTSPVVIKAMYDTLEQLGFKEGNILEPSCGVGNFFGLLPDSMQNSKLYGIELDSITGRIAQQLYPKADIKVMGFEKAETPDAFFDVAIGNVPFGSYKINDQRYKKNDFFIHDYFFAKTLDQVRPGGVIAFVTSKGTLDKANPEVRKYIAQRAELLGAVRLPNNAFLKNAGTEVTSDIIFLQKRDRLVDIQPDWVHLGMTDKGIPVNSYFVDNPDMILGTMSNDSGLRMYGNENSTTCVPLEGAVLAEQLKTALSRIQGQIIEAELDSIADEKPAKASIPADTHLRNFSYTMINGDVYFRENSRMYPVEMPTATLERVKDMIGLRDVTHKLIQYQLDDYPDSYIREIQNELNSSYDVFLKKHGLISSSTNNRLFSADSAYYLLCSLEILDENGNLERKSDMFTKRTIKRNVVVTSVDTSAESLAVSIAQKARVEMDYMAELTGFAPEKIIGDLQGVVFCDIGNPNHNLPPFDPEKMKLHEKFPFVTADEYLSGNVREKLKKARAFHEAVGDDFYGVNPLVNIKALEQAQPKDLDASEISVRLGATWVDKEYVQEFMYDILKTPDYWRNEIKVAYSERTDEWNISGKTMVSNNDVLATSTYGTTRANAYKIMEDTLNLRDVRVYDTDIVDGKEQRILNKKETTLACQRQEAIKEKFKEWIFSDHDRRKYLTAKYNLLFNSTRPREYDGSHIDFVGMSPEISLKSHQTAAIARILYGGNTLLAHEVGAGKTFVMVGAAMESRRLGLCQKNMLAVPNHLTEQMASEFLRLYPSANILVATKKDFETKNRKKFCAKIATGDYDCVIIGHSQLEKIPLSTERQKRLLDEQIYEITEGIEELKRSRGERFTIKQLEKTKKSLEARLEKLTDSSRKDDVVTFEQLGVDRLYVDESHNFKNLFLYTKMRNVAGLATSEAQKSSDLFMKCRYLDEITGNKGIIFATGTPISNSMAEMYTVQRYLQYDTLVRNGHMHFDAWASNFGETTTSVELSPEGSGYRARTRFAKFNNLPELMNIFKEVADIKTADTLDLPRPQAHFHTIIAKPTEIQQEMVQKLSVRAKDVHDRKVDATVDNMLKITSDGRKIGLDQRLMDSLLPDDPGSKVTLCMENVFRIWEETADSRLTQLIFCDFSTPNKDGRFNVYDDIKVKLLKKGIPENEVAFIHDANTEMQKKELFGKIRRGQVRVLLGSTFKCGAGTNIQDRLIALHDLDCPWRPADLTQRLGRILRQGNQNPEVDIYRYVTESTFDSYLFQTVEKKQEFISQIMTSKSPVRSCNDVDEDALSYAEIKALCAGNPHIKEKMQLDIEVSKLKMFKSDHQSQQYRLQDDILQHLPKRIESTKARIEGFKADMKRLESNTFKTEESISPMIIGGKKYTDRGKAGDALIEACSSITTTEPVKIGSYRGFDMLISFDSFNKKFVVDMKGSITHSAELGSDGGGNITRINNAFDRIPMQLSSAEAQLEILYGQQENAKAELGKPFEREQELAEKSARLAELDSLLNMDEKPDALLIGDADNEPEESSVQSVSVQNISQVFDEKIKENTDKIAQEKKAGNDVKNLVIETQEMKSLKTMLDKVDNRNQPININGSANAKNMILQKVYIGKQISNIRNNEKENSSGLEKGR